MPEYEKTKNFISVLNKAVKIPKKSKCWNTILLPSKNVDNLKNYIAAIANSGENVPTRCNKANPEKVPLWNK